jgi:hypothetical protein
VHPYAGSRCLAMFSSLLSPKKAIAPDSESPQASNPVQETPILGERLDLRDLWLTDLATSCKGSVDQF